MDPEIGDTTTNFIYKVTYSDSEGDMPAFEYPKVHIKKAGLEISGSPFSMNYETGGFATGAIYSFSTTLNPGSDYTYYFEAYDTFSNLAAGTPTIPVDAPGVKNDTPVLNWTGEINYTSDGLDPDIGDRSMTFTYCVEYTDPNGDTAATGYPKVYIKKGGINILGSPFSMNYESGTYLQGAIYSYTTKLSAGTDYTYYFEAFDTWGLKASGQPINSSDAPDVSNNDPLLTYTGESNYFASGVYPNWGKPGTRFYFKVKYSDPDGDTPAVGYPKLHIFKGGVEILGSPLALVYETGAYVTGAIYGCSKTLDEIGRDYAYYFEASDTYGRPAGGDLVSQSKGPNVTISEQPGKLILVNNLFSPMDGDKVQIQYEVAEEGSVSITVHDSLGKEIITLIRERKSPGIYADLTWDGKNSMGEFVASGVYIIYIKAGSYKEMKKLIVIN